MNGWKPLPVLLKVLCVLLVLWVAMSLMVLLTMPEREVAFFGLILTGTAGALVVIVLDVLCPLLFLVAAWKRRGWGAAFGMAYNAVFALNMIVSLLLFREKFGNAIWFPLVASLIFLGIIARERRYFRQA
jgi:hypothetical protein